MSQTSAEKVQRKNSPVLHPAFWSGLLAPAVTVLVLAPGLMARAVAVLLLWRWYVSPMGVQPLSYSASFGIALIFRILDGDRYKPNDDRSLTVRWFGAITGPVILLFIGWVMRFVL